MNALIPISEQDGKQAVNARDLHAFLESKRQFGNWISYRIKKYGLIENQDYCEVFNNFVKNPQGGRPQVEYALTLDCAKELSMVEGNAKGKEARQYFIECEKTLEKVAKGISIAEQLLLQAQLIVKQESRLFKIEQQIKQLKPKKADKTLNQEYLSIVAYAAVKQISITVKQTVSLSSQARTLCKKYDMPIRLIKHRKLVLFPRIILEMLFDKVFNKGGAL